MNRRWLVNKTNDEFLAYISKNASISTAFAQILVNRGLKDITSINDFLSPSLQNLHDPFLMPDVGKAVERIKSASAKKETVLVCGDYDADGVTSTALLIYALRKLGLKTFYHIPNRITEGYGLSEHGIQKAKAVGAGLIITVDCGISSENEIAMASSNGIDTIVTDHHEPPEKLPEATAVINPCRADSEYPCKNLAGVGVVYKLAQALLQNAELDEELLALVAVGTIADSVPLTGENRIFVAFGLKVLGNGSIMPWIDSLKEVSGIGDKYPRSGLLSYTIIPRINAAGRLGGADQVVELFLTQDKNEAKKIARFLENQNRQRQRIEEDVLKSAIDMLRTYPPDEAIVLHSHEWHQGVIGIVASRLAEMFYKPAFLFSVKDSVAKGSARSIPALNIYKSISECAELLIGFGGHKQAAGIKLRTDNLPAFKKKINSVIEKNLTAEDTVPTLEIDAAVELFEINSNLVREINLLEPFGYANPEPLLGAKDVEIINPRIVGNNHIKMRLKQKSSAIDTIGFCMGDSLEEVNGSNAVDIVFVPRINEWNGNKTLQLNLRALRPR